MISLEGPTSLVFIPVGEVFRVEGECDRLRFTRCDVKAAEGFQFFVGSCNCGALMGDVELDNLVTIACAGVSDVDGRIYEVAVAENGLVDAQSGLFLKYM